MRRISLLLENVYRGGKDRHFASTTVSMQYVIQTGLLHSITFGNAETIIVDEMLC